MLFRPQAYSPLLKTTILAWLLCLAVSVTAQEEAALEPKQQLKAYLVSRSLRSAPGIASHRFIAIGLYPGDPDAEIFSFSHEEGKAGRNYDSALRKDCRAWLRIDREIKRTRRLLNGVNATVIPAPVHLVRAYAENLIENLDYNLFGTNSNSLAQAVANRAAGQDVKVFENRLFGALGRRQWRKVSFRFSPENKILLVSHATGKGPSCPNKTGKNPVTLAQTAETTTAEATLATAN